MNPFTYRSSSLRDPEAVLALRRLFNGDDRLVHAVACGYQTWEEFAAASTESLAHLIGANVPAIPPHMPAPAPLPKTVQLLCRYSPGFPADLRDAAAPPSVLFVTGTLPDQPYLAVVGAENPSMTGADLSRSAGLAAAAAGVPVVAPLTVGCSLLAVQAAVDAGGRAVIVLPHGFGVTSTHQLLLERVLDGGGAVLTTFEPGTRTTEVRADMAARIAVTSASAVVLAEVGFHRQAACAAAAAAVEAGKFLIVPSPAAAPESGRYIPPTALGSALFTSPREWSSDHYGSNARIAQRTMNGLSPADAVVATHADLAAAVTVGCRPR